MACYKPISGWYSETRKEISFKKPAYPAESIQLPCGRCIGCKLDVSKGWALRCTHEAMLHEDNCFITLTYDDYSLPRIGGHPTLYKPDFKNFIKRARNHLPKFRYVMCGEYGDENDRPHYHALLFGVDFPDRKYLKKTDSGHRLDTSETLDMLWGNGHTYVGDMSFDTAAYVARYTLKKVTGDLAKEHYARVDVDTAEITYIQPEYATRSNRPGIGHDWFTRYMNDVYPKDFVTSGGHKIKPPRYYDILFERFDNDIGNIKVKRKEHARKNKADNTPERLEQREEVKRAQTRTLRRK